MFEEIAFVTDNFFFHWSDTRRVFQLLSESARNLSFLHLSPDVPRYDPFVRPSRVHVLPKTQLTSLDLSGVSGVDDRMIKVIVKSCPELKLLYIGPRAEYTSVAVRAIADGLPQTGGRVSEGRKRQR
jgi:hypothetical protein